MRNAIGCLVRELNDIERMLTSLEESIAASREKRRAAASPKGARGLLATLSPPFPEPDFGLWLQEDR
jgi:hypothetical protein